MYVQDRGFKAPQITLLMVSRRAVNDVQCASTTATALSRIIAGKQIKEQVAVFHSAILKCKYHIL